MSIKIQVPNCCPHCGCYSITLHINDRERFFVCGSDTCGRSSGYAAMPARATSTALVPTASPFWWVVKSGGLYLAPSFEQQFRLYVDKQHGALVITSRARARELATACGATARVVMVKARPR